MMDKKDFLKCQPVVMEEMLIAREKRSSIQRELLNQYKLPLISFTLNISGSYKTFPLAEKSFEEGKKLIRNHLRRNKILIKHEEDNSSKTGYEYYIVADNNPNFIKKLMLEIENSSLLGRIFDIDVLKEDGNKITRDEIGETNRACILCNNMAHVCSRSRKHSQEELINKIIEIMYDYFNHKFANMCSACACKALLYEVITTPKPGLVDRANNGSHKDMDIFTFIDSTSVLVPYFRDYVMTGIEFCYDEPYSVFERLRYLGMEAEDHMFRATDNVNTQKGLIFSMGIICAVLGYLYGNHKSITVESILDMTKIMSERVMDDFENVTINNAKTYGEKLYAYYGITGIRGEVNKGFISVKEYGLPVIENLVSRGFSLNHAGALTLLNLIVNVKDTNIIARTDIKTLEYVQKKINMLIEENLENVTLDDINNIDREFIIKNINPGGCADLLAITYMLYFIKQINHE